MVPKTTYTVTQLG